MYWPENTYQQRAHKPVTYRVRSCSVGRCGEKILPQMSKHSIRAYVRFSSLIVKTPFKIPRMTKLSSKKMRTTFFIFPSI